jgi:hypothetical protein
MIKRVYYVQADVLRRVWITVKAENAKKAEAKVSRMPGAFAILQATKERP